MGAIGPESTAFERHPDPAAVLVSPFFSVRASHADVVLARLL